MKILLVTQYFWPESFIINGLATELQSRGHQVEVLTGLPNYPKGQLYDGYSLIKGAWAENYKGVPVHRSFLVPRGKGFYRLALNYLSFILFACIRAVFLKNQYDVILCYAPSPVTACLPAIFIRWLKKTPLAFWVQDLWPESVSAVGATRSSLIIDTIGQLVRFIYRRCDMIFVQSEGFKPSIERWGGQLSQTHWVPNWADPFVEAPEPEWVRNLPKGFKIGFAGNIGKAQDMPTLLAAAEILKEEPDIKWIVVGDGSEKKWLDGEIKNRGLEETVFTVGSKPYNEMLPFFKSCEGLYVSLTDDYIFSLTIPAKVQAYMSARRPILASIGGEGARLVEESQSGFAFGPCRPQDLAESVKKLRQMGIEERVKLGNKGYEYFMKNFEKKLVVDRIEILLKQLARIKK